MRLNGCRAVPVSASRPSVQRYRYGPPAVFAVGSAAEIRFGDPADAVKVVSKTRTFRLL